MLTLRNIKLPSFRVVSECGCDPFPTQGRILSVPAQFGTRLPDSQATMPE